jgi:hypothetical protein
MDCANFFYGKPVIAEIKLLLMNADFSAAKRETLDQPASPNNLTAGRPARSTTFWWLILVGLAAATLCVPFVHFIHCVCSDEGIFLFGAERMLGGSKLYLDFFEFLPPGSFAITTAWFAIAGISMWSARSLTILTIAGIACFTYLACLQASKHRTYSVLLAVGSVVVSQGTWTQVSHHWFTTLLSMATASATLASVEHSRRWLRGSLFAGIAAGAAVMVTPTQGMLVMLAGATAFVNLRRYRADLVAYVLGSALIPTCLLAYVIKLGALRAAFEDLIVFPATRYLRVSGMPFAYGTDWQNVPLKYLFPVAATLALVIYVRGWRTCLQDRLLRTSAAFGLAGWIGFLPRPDVPHIAFAAPLVLPLFACCATRIMEPWPPKYRYATVAVVIGLCIPSILAFTFLAKGVFRAETWATPRGNVTFLSGQRDPRELAAWITATPIEETYFFYPYMPILPFLTGRHQVSRYDFFVPDFTLPGQYQEACVSAMQGASWVVIDRRWTDLDTLREVFLKLGYKPLETDRFEQALERGFEFVVRIGQFEIRRRVKSIPESICANIAE